MKPRSPVVAPSASRPPRVARARVVGRARSRGTGRRERSRQLGRGAAWRGRRRARDCGGGGGASQGTLRVRHGCARARGGAPVGDRGPASCQRDARRARLHPEAERRAAASATRALAGARRLLAELAESRDVSVPSPSAATRASPVRLRASPSPSRARARAPGETAASFPGTDSVPVPSASPVLPARSPTSRASPGTSASPNVPAASPARRSSPGKPRVESPAPARRSASRALFPAFDTDERHAAAVRLQRIQRGRAARAGVKAMSEARRSAARGIPVDPHAPPSRPGSPRTRESGGEISGGSRRSSRVGATRDAPRASDGGTRREGGDLRDGGRRRGRREPSGSVRACDDSVAGSNSTGDGGPVESRVDEALVSTRHGKKRIPGRTRGTSGGASSETEDGRGGGGGGETSRGGGGARVSRRRVRGPGEEAFYERLNDARKSRRISAGRNPGRGRDPGRSPLPPPRRRSEDPPRRRWRRRRTLRAL